MATETKKPFLKRAFDVFMEDYIEYTLYSLGMLAFFLYMLNGKSL